MVNPADANLCSLKDTEGLDIELPDGEIGQVSDFMVSEETGEIVWIVVNTRLAAQQLRDDHD